MWLFGATILPQKALHRMGYRLNGIDHGLAAVSTIILKAVDFQHVKFIPAKKLFPLCTEQLVVKQHEF